MCYRSVDSGSLASFSSDYKSAPCCVTAIITYLELLNKDDKFEQFSIEKYDLSLYVVLDSAASSALNLFSKTQTNRQGLPPDSIYSLLNHCQTPQVTKMVLLQLLW